MNTLTLPATRPMHSVAALLHQRRASKSSPGNRTDGRKIALSLEGGGMRGVVSGGMVAALEQLGMLNCFDAVYGSSAGAISGAYFVAGQARYGVTIFYENINNKSFLNPLRLASRKPVLSLEFLLDHVCIHEKPLDTEKVISSKVPLIALSSSITTLTIAKHSNFFDEADLFGALRCSARIPVIAGHPVAYRGDFFLDAAVLESIPYQTIIDDGFTDVVALMTRPDGVTRAAASKLDRFLIAPRLARHNAQLPSLYLRKADGYLNEVAAIKEASRSGSPIATLPVQMLPNEPAVSSNSIDRSELVAGAMAGFRAVYRALSLPEPNLTEIITPIPVGHAANNFAAADRL